MSYIRSPYNPEGLYIWSQLDGMCVFMMGEDIIGKMPSDIFDALIDIYIEDPDDEYTEFHDARVEEVWIDTENGKELRTRLSYNHEWEIDMWDVTWYYIARSNYGRSKPRWKLRWMRRIFGNWI
jgi:hypothetical protein